MCEFANSFASVKARMQAVAQAATSFEGAISYRPEFSLEYMPDVGCVIEPVNAARIHVDDLRNLAAHWRKLAIKFGLNQTLTFNGRVFI